MAEKVENYEKWIVLELSVLQIFHRNFYIPSNGYDHSGYDDVSFPCNPWLFYYCGINQY